MVAKFCNITDCSRAVVWRVANTGRKYSVHVNLCSILLYIFILCHCECMCEQLSNEFDHRKLS